MERYTESFFTLIGDRLSPHRRQLVEKVLSAYQEILQRQREGPQTLAHGDAHCWNFLVPLTETETVLLIDWEFWNVDIATNDLAFMMAVSWYPERRQRLEQSLLRRYYDALLTHGVSDVSWEMCWYHYRLSIAKHLLTPIAQHAHGLDARVWWHNMEPCFLSFEDLGCAAIL